MQSSGGVLLIWDKRVFEKLDVIAGQFSVIVLLRGVVDDFVRSEERRVGKECW